MRIVIDNQSGLNLEKFAGVQIYRPSYYSEVKSRTEAEANLRSKFRPGTYSDPATINSLLQHQFAHFSKKLGDLIPKAASRHFMEFILSQFDQASTIEDLNKQGGLNQAEAEKWDDIGPRFRRAVKYLAERVVQLQPDEAPEASEELLAELSDQIWIAAEEMVDLYILSDQTFMIFPKDTTVEIYPEGTTPFWELKLHKTCNFSQDVNRDTANRSIFVGPEISTPLLNIDQHDQVIGSALKNAIGASYKEAISVLRMVVDGSQPAPDGFPTLFVHFSNLVDIVSQHTQLLVKTVETILNGFTITKAKMESEGREIWKPKQEYRAFRRAFFEMPHSSGTHIAFSKRMAMESWLQLTLNVVFNQFPVEWRNPSVDSGLAMLSNLAGTWFEKVVEENLGKIGFKGLRSIKKMIGEHQDKVYIPADVGEIDFLGYSENEKLMIIAECKMVQGSYEGKFFRDDMSDFVTSKKSYLSKFSRKVQWVIQNQGAVISALNSSGIYSTAVELGSIATAIITFFPNIAQYFIYEYPCVSLTNLMLDYREAGKWPYSVGIY